MVNNGAADMRILTLPQRQPPSAGSLSSDIGASPSDRTLPPARGCGNAMRILSIRAVRGEKALPALLLFCTVSVLQEIPMRHDHFRYTYRPTAIHLPRWARRIWSWF